MVRSWGRLEVGSAPSSNLVRRWGNTCGWKMGQPGLKTGQVRRWGTTYIYTKISKIGQIDQVLNSKINVRFRNIFSESWISFSVTYVSIYLLASCIDVVFRVCTGH